MKIVYPFKLCLPIIAYTLWLLGCAQPNADSGKQAVDVDSAPVHAQSLEPTLSEAVSRVFNRSCSACHGPAGHGIAAVAPDLRRAKPRSVEQWKQYLINPQGGHPGSDLPPPTWINVDESEVIAGYLFNILPLADANAIATNGPNTQDKIASAHLVALTPKTTSPASPKAKASKATDVGVKQSPANTAKQGQKASVKMPVKTPVKAPPKPKAR